MASIELDDVPMVGSDTADEPFRPNPCPSATAAASPNNRLATNTKTASNVAVATPPADNCNSRSLMDDTPTGGWKEGLNDVQPLNDDRHTPLVVADTSTLSNPELPSDQAAVTSATAGLVLGGQCCEPSETKDDDVGSYYSGDVSVDKKDEEEGTSLVPGGVEKTTKSRRRKSRWKRGGRAVVKTTQTCFQAVPRFVLNRVVSTLAASEDRPGGRRRLLLQQQPKQAQHRELVNVDDEKEEEATVDLVLDPNQSRRRWKRRWKEKKNTMEGAFPTSDTTSNHREQSLTTSSSRFRQWARSMRRIDSPTTLSSEREYPASMEPTTRDVDGSESDYDCYSSCYYYENKEECLTLAQWVVSTDVCNTYAQFIIPRSNETRKLECQTDVWRDDEEEGPELATAERAESVDGGKDSDDQVGSPREEGECLSPSY